MILPWDRSVAAGAVEITMRDMARMRRERRQA
ncbi:hypothetical protein RSWS8N_16004 [Cereibacter sphaeroides WS8N]|nr:hypothetical protein RSWS8N_16004 [Cereibacter sphaeroides WS8N]